MTDRIHHGELASCAIPQPVPYAVLLPPGHQRADALPLLLDLHPGGTDCNWLVQDATRNLYDKLWAESALPPMIVASYSAADWHLNVRDGSARWEDFAFAFIEHMHDAWHVRTGRTHTYLLGISMGAMGGMRLALKHPDRFALVAALEGVFNPALNPSDLSPRNFGVQYNLPAEAQARLWGHPVDPAFYRANNHANIAQDNADAIRKWAPKIYLECGDRDYYNAHDGAEFLHRTLWAQGIEHEYRLLHGCDHVGPSLNWRMEDALRWLGRIALNLTNPRPDLRPSQEQLDFMHRAAAGHEDLSQLHARFGLRIDDASAVALWRETLPRFLADHANDPLGGVFRTDEPVGDDRN